MATMSCKLSVVICTYDRYELLNETIAMLIGSRGFAETSCEVLVVENTPKVRRQKVHLADLPNLRLQVCEEPGLSHARNFGISNTTGEIVAFLDDDALVCDSWCSEILDPFSQPKILVVGGKVEPQYQTEKLPPWYDGKLAGYLSCIDWCPRARHLRPGEWIVGANMAYRRSVFERYGLFDVSLGRQGTGSLLSNDETSLLARVGMQRVLYNPAACVQHVIPAERLSTRWFRRRVYWQAVSDILSGLTRTDDPALRLEYGKVIGQLEAERRNLNALYFEPDNYDQFAIQLRAIYLAAVLLGAGGP
jgi:GT2 family glycosyltransferase